jgi:hypothetical protein
VKLDLTDPKTRRRLMRYGALAGVVLGIACNLLPPRYQATCAAVAKVAALPCGGSP